MPTIAEQLTQLESDRSDLVDNLETMGITGLSGDETFTELVPEVLNIQGGADLNDYFNSTISGGSNRYAGDILKKIPDNILVSGTDLQYAFRNYKGTTAPILDTSSVTNFYSMFYGCPNITTIPQYSTSSGTNFGSMFKECYALTSVPLMDLSNATSVQSMFDYCENLTTIPVFDIPKITYNYAIDSMFRGCNSLSNDSLDNILQMCIGATSYVGTKTLVKLGISSSYYQASTIEGLTHYQDFIDAGWTIGF